MNLDPPSPPTSFSMERFDASKKRNNHVNVSTFQFEVSVVRKKHQRVGELPFNLYVPCHLNQTKTLLILSIDIDFCVIFYYQSQMVSAISVWAWQRGSCKSLVLHSPSSTTSNWLPSKCGPHGPTIPTFADKKSFRNGWRIWNSD